MIQPDGSGTVFYVILISKSGDYAIRLAQSSSYTDRDFLDRRFMVLGSHQIVALKNAGWYSTASDGLSHVERDIMVAPLHSLIWVCPMHVESAYQVRECAVFCVMNGYRVDRHHAPTNNS